MRFYIFISLILYSAVCIAQTDWAPVGAKWHYNFNENDFTTIESIGDTIIQNKNCSILKLNHTTDSLKICTYSEDNKVWYFKNGKFNKLYDFTAKVGDTWQIVDIFNLCGTDSLVTIKVDSVGIASINGNTLKYIVVRFLSNDRWGFHCYGEFGSPHKIIEHIGALGYMFPRRFCALDYPYPCDLRCYSDENFGFYQSYIVDSCAYVKTNINEQFDTKEINIYPNPAQDLINISVPLGFDAVRLEIFDMLGRKLLRPLIEKEAINITDLEEGMYIVLIKDKDGRILSEKFVKK